MRKAATSSSRRPRPSRRTAEACGGILACLEDNKMSRTKPTTKKGTAAAAAAAIVQKQHRAENGGGRNDQSTNTKSLSSSASLSSLSFSSPPPVKSVAFSSKLPRQQQSSSSQEPSSLSDHNDRQQKQQQHQQAFLDLSPFTASSASMDASEQDESDESSSNSSSETEDGDEEEEESDTEEEESPCESSGDDGDDDSSSHDSSVEDEQGEKEASDDCDDATTLSAVAEPLTGRSLHDSSTLKKKRRPPASKRGPTDAAASKEMDEHEDFEQVCRQLHRAKINVDDDDDDDEYNPDGEESNDDASSEEEASHDDEDDDDVLEFDDEEDSLVERRLEMARKKKEAEELASAAAAATSNGPQENDDAVATVLNDNDNDDQCEEHVDAAADPFDDDEEEENGSSRGGVNGSIVKDQTHSSDVSNNNNCIPTTTFSPEMEKMTRGLDRCELSDNDSRSASSTERHGETGNNNSSFFADQTIEAGADLLFDDDEDDYEQQSSFHGVATNMLNPRQNSSVNDADQKITLEQQISCRSCVNPGKATVKQATCTVPGESSKIVDTKGQGTMLSSTVNSRNMDNVEDIVDSTVHLEGVDEVFTDAHLKHKKADLLCVTQKRYRGAKQQTSGKLVNGSTKQAVIVKDKVSAVNQQIVKKKSPPSNHRLKSKPKSRSLHRSRSEGIIKPGKWALGSKIGSGAFGVVHIGMNTQTGTLMAVKSFEMDRAVMKDIRREIHLLKSLEHPNIVRYYGAEMDKNKLCIFQEWVPAGSVTELLARFGPFTLSVIRSYLSQTLSGLSYLHSQDIMHRDIKGSNILVNDEGIVKLADFGASKKLAELQSGKMMSLTVQGTPYFMAPEVFEGKYSVKADIWAVGCLAYQMAAGFPPWKNLGFTNPFALSTFVQKQTTPPTLVLNCPDSAQTDQASNYLRNLVEKCCNRVAHERPDASTLLDEAFFVSSNDISSSKSDDEQSTDPRGLFSPESHDTSSYLESPHTRRNSGNLQSPSLQNASSDCTHNRSNSIGPPCRSVLCSPPVPNQQSGAQHHLQANTMMQISPAPPCFSPTKLDPSRWPSWARKKYKESGGADVPVEECSKDLEVEEKENVEIVDSLEFSGDSSAYFLLQPSGVSTDVSCLLLGEKFLPPSSSKP
jgi:serine/threonine protein kinase